MHASSASVQAARRARSHLIASILHQTPFDPDASEAVGGQCCHTAQQSTHCLHLWMFLMWMGRSRLGKPSWEINSRGRRRRGGVSSDKSRITRNTTIAHTIKHVRLAGRLASGNGLSTG